MTQEQQDKQSFFGLYINQAVLSIDINRKRRTEPLTPTRIERYAWQDDSYLELRSLQSISDEDAIEVATVYEPFVPLKVSQRNTFSVRIAHTDDDGDHDFCTIFFDGEIDNGGNHGSTHDLQAYDYLRSRGYLLPFRSYSIQQLLDMGWAKIKEV
jgi:hypothetical protein